MTRDRHTPDEGGRTAAATLAGCSPPRAESLWDALHRVASPQQRDDIRALVEQHGYLDTARLDPALRDAAARPAPETSPLAAILHGQLSDLPPVTVHEVSFVDAQLDPAQREAVVRAVSTP